MAITTANGVTCRCYFLLPQRKSSSSSIKFNRHVSRFTSLATSITTEYEDAYATLKTQILSSVAGLDRGILASEEEVRSADAAVQKLEEAAGKSVEFPRDLDMLQGQWRLIYSSAFASRNRGGHRPGPPVNRFPLSLGQVYQRIDVLSSEFDNIVDIRIATPWPLSPLEVRATLAHSFVCTGGAGIKITFEKTIVKASGLPTFDLPRLPAALSSFQNSNEGGEFDVSYVDSSFRISRGRRGQVRIFVKPY